MHWATTTFRSDGAPELPDALRAWRDHIIEAHPKVREVRYYGLNAGTSIVWPEEFDESCGGRTSRVWRRDRSSARRRGPVDRPCQTC